MSVADWFASIALISGAALSLIAGLAVVRFPDTASRVHAATKPQTLGIVLLMVGLGIRLGTVAVIGELVLIVILQLLTAPVAAHLTVRQAYRHDTLRAAQRTSNADEPTGTTAADTAEGESP